MFFFHIFAGNLHQFAAMPWQDYCIAGCFWHIVLRELSKTNLLPEESRNDTAAATTAAYLHPLKFASHNICP